MQAGYLYSEFYIDMEKTDPLFAFHGDEIIHCLVHYLQYPLKLHAEIISQEIIIDLTYENLNKYAEEFTFHYKSCR